MMAVLCCSVVVLCQLCVSVWWCTIYNTAKTASERLLTTTTYNNIITPHLYNIINKHCITDEIPTFQPAPVRSLISGPISHWSEPAKDFSNSRNILHVSWYILVRTTTAVFFHHKWYVWPHVTRICSAIRCTEYCNRLVDLEVARCQRRPNRAR